MDCASGAHIGATMRLANADLSVTNKTKKKANTASKQEACRDTRDECLSRLCMVQR